ncbi:DUF1707 domain-containing protein [Mycobacterium sp. NPDC006124]|uniref:DUF1707 domain-containing protein n=1 Tax=Mycobacterium sp. NPDC006124 TaxID=3156729 RepID=UPI0033B28689
MNCPATQPYVRLRQRSPIEPAARARDTRANDTDRGRTANVLGQAFAQGYLDLAEYDDRLRQTWEAVTGAALGELLVDLPVGSITRRDPRRRAARVAAARRGVLLHVLAYSTIAGTCLAVWLAVALSVSAWYFWPIWPILGGGVAVVAHAIPVHLYGGSSRSGVSP